jgi:hypothetical protein
MVNHIPDLIKPVYVCRQALGEIVTLSPVEKEMAAEELVETMRAMAVVPAAQMPVERRKNPTERQRVAPQALQPQRQTAVAAVA